MTAIMQRLTLPLRDAAETTVAAVVACLRSGGLVLAPTDTTYGLLADAEQPQAYARVFEAKGRALDQPVPLLLADISQAEAFLAAPFARGVDTLVRLYWPGALTVVVSAGDAIVPHLIDRAGHVGLRVPDHAFIRAVAEALGGPLTGTSANRSGEPPATTARDADLQLGAWADCLVDGGVATGAPSTVVDTTTSPWRILRRGAISGQAISAATGMRVQEG